MPDTLEKKRLQSLRELNLLDTAPEERFDRITRLAASILGTETALISLVDEDRQWFKSAFGLDAVQTPRSDSFCAHAIAGSDTFIIPDASTDDRFSDNPLVTGNPNIRFYAGCSLTTEGGFKVGTLCVIDSKPRIMTSAERATLESLAQIAQDEINLHSKIALLENIKAAQNQVDRFFAMTHDLFCVMDLRGSLLKLSSSFEKALGLAQSELLGKSFLYLIHDQDRDASRNVLKALSDQPGKRLSYQNRFFCEGGGVTLVSWEASYDPEFQLIYAVGSLIAPNAR